MVRLFTVAAASKVAFDEVELKVTSSMALGTASPPQLAAVDQCASPPPPSQVATLYQHCNFGGWSIPLAPGDYTTADLVALGGRDNDASSLRVNPGFEVTLYDGANFTGAQLVITAETSCLVASSFNDRLSSLRVRAVGAAQ